MNHKEFIDIAQFLGYQSITYRGLCYGFAMMWAQAVCARDLDSFKNRLMLLNQYKSNPQQLVFEIDLIRNKCKNREYIPTEEERKLLEIPALFEGIALYLSPGSHDDVFDDVDITQTKVETISRYTASEKQEYLQTTFFTVDQFNHLELATFLSQIARQMGDRTDIPLIFGAYQHAVSARYIGNGQFEYIDTNSNVNGDMIHWQGDAQGLAEQLFQSLATKLAGTRIHQEQHLPLSCTLYVPNNSPIVDFENCHNKNKITDLPQDRFGGTVLDLAARHNDMSLIERVDFDKVDLKNSTALIIACGAKSDDVFNYLLALEQINLNGVDNTGRTFLNHLIRQCKFDMLRDFLTDERVTSWDNPYVLFDLVCDGSDDAIEITRILLEEKKIPINPEQLKNWTPLHVACAKGNYKMAELLLVHGANKEAKDNLGKNPLHVAAELGNAPIVDLLIQHGAPLNAKDNDSNTAFDRALQNKRFDVAERLLPKTKIDSQFFGKNWSLHVLECSVDLQKEILKKGLLDYIEQRSAETVFTLNPFGYSKKEKIAAAHVLLQNLDAPVPNLTLKDIEILHNGRLSHLYTEWQKFHVKAYAQSNDPHQYIEISRSYSNLVREFKNNTNETEEDFDHPFVP